MLKAVRVVSPACVIVVQGGVVHGAERYDGEHPLDVRLEPDAPVPDAPPKAAEPPPPK